MTRSLTTFQKVLVAVVIFLLVGGGTVKWYYSHLEVARVKADLKREQSPDAVVMAHVKGAVAKPGLYTLKKGARVNDAIEAAGGFADGAQGDALNLAAFVKDGDEIVVPRGGSAGGSRRGDSMEKLAPGRTVDINTAGAAELQKIPGVGPGIAARIVALRKQRGPFRKIEEIRLVHGIGEGRFGQMKSFISIGSK